MLPVRFTLLTSATCLLALLAAGCSDPDKPREIKVKPGYDNLRMFRTAYMQATASLNRPPKNVEEMKSFLVKFGDPSEVLRSTHDGTDLVIAWGADLRTMKPDGNRWPVWVYEKNSHNGKRWVLEERNPREMTDDEFARALFAPGMKE